MTTASPPPEHVDHRRPDANPRSGPSLPLAVYRDPEFDNKPEHPTACWQAASPIIEVHINRPGSCRDRYLLVDVGPELTRA